MSAPKLTPWFPGTVKPAKGAEHVGPYLREFDYGDVAYSWWDGKQWLYGAANTPEKANRSSGRSPRQDRRWRGLAQKP